MTQYKNNRKQKQMANSLSGFTNVIHVDAWQDNSLNEQRLNLAS